MRNGHEGSISGTFHDQHQSIIFMLILRRVVGVNLACKDPIFREECFRWLSPTRNVKIYTAGSVLLTLATSNVLSVQTY